MHGPPFPSPQWSSPPTVALNHEGWCESPRRPKPDAKDDEASAKARNISSPERSSGCQCSSQSDASTHRPSNGATPCDGSGLHAARSSETLLHPCSKSSCSRRRYKLPSPDQLRLIPGALKIPRPCGPTRMSALCLPLLWTVALESLGCARGASHQKNKQFSLCPPKVTCDQTSQKLLVTGKGLVWPLRLTLAGVKRGWLQFSFIDFLKRKKSRWAWRRIGASRST